MKINPLLMIDYYKATHSMMYPKGITKLNSYFTPRSSRIEDDALANFGLIGYIEEYLIDGFADFFTEDEDKVVAEYERILNATLGKNMYDSEKVRQLHRLGYLPLEISEVPEGRRVPIGVPMLEVTNTHPDFAWLVNTIESSMSAYLWHPMVCAEVGWKYKNVVNEWYGKTVSDDVPRERALGDFSFRGQESPESAITSSAAWLLSFVNSATVPAILYLEQHYHADAEKEPVGYGAVSTEHSVMCSNAAVDGNETAMLKRLLTEIYPEGYFTCVCDSYDYWNVVDNLIPSLHEEIMGRNGCFAVRGDSGNPVDIVCETVERLWDEFGGQINEKGYKVLDPHVKAVYGDSITLRRCVKIYDRLEKAGFAANNVSLGVGSFSMQCIEEEPGKLSPFTRDTFGCAFKSTYCEVGEQEIPIYKDPKTDSGIKKSHKGIVRVYETEDGQLKYIDGLTRNDLETRDDIPESAMETVFLNGNIMNRPVLSDMRRRLLNS